jgi:hypothetical protein
MIVIAGTHAGAILRSARSKSEEAMIPERLALVGALLLAGALQGADWARADAALAVSQIGDVAKKGVAIGWAVDYASKEAARAEALARCRAFPDAQQATRDACRIIETFSDRCLAVALDPAAGTTGVGWGVHKNRDWAEEEAMERCAESSASKRRASCRVALVRCDGR